MRDAAGEVHHIKSALHFPARIRHHLSVLGGDHMRKVIQVCRDELAELEHHLRATRHRRIGPGRKSTRRVLDGRDDILARGKIHARLDLAGVGIEDVGKTGAAAAARGAHDMVVKLAHSLGPRPTETASGIILK